MKRRLRSRLVREVFDIHRLQQTQVTRWIRFLIVFLSMTAITIGAGYYGRGLANERATFFEMDLPQASKEVVTIDLGTQGWPKHLVQPGRMRLGSLIKGTGYLAAKPVNLLITTTSSPNISLLHPYSRNRVATNQGYNTFLIPGRNVPLVFELDIPRKNTRQRDVGTITVQVTDRDQGRLLGEVTFVVRNSRSDAIWCAEADR